MTTDIKRIIEQAFAEVIRPPSDKLIAFQGDEEKEDTEFFKDRLWQEVDPSILSRHHYALYWFTPEAFHYYLPTFLFAGLTEPSSVYVITIFFLLKPTNDETLAKFRKERWKLLSEAQIQVLEKWLLYLHSQVKPGGEVELEDALRVVRERYWW